MVKCDRCGEKMPAYFIEDGICSLCIEEQQVRDKQKAESQKD